MKQKINPFTPGAGTQPAELAGREKIIEGIEVAFERILSGRMERGSVLYGLRGVGKTVLLQRLYGEARDRVKCVFLEVSETAPLHKMIIPAMRKALLSMSMSEKVKRAIAALWGVAKNFKISLGDLHLGISPELGLADSGDWEHDLTMLMEAVGEAALDGETAFVIFIDELQYLKNDDLVALCAALHWVNQRGLPVLLICAGLPQVRGNLGNAKTYSERQFHFLEIGALSGEAAREAIVKPAAQEGVEFEAAAVSHIVAKTHGYPYFLQEWGKQTWDATEQPPITLADVQRASEQAVRSLDKGFFRVRFDLLTPAEKRYLRGMAELTQNSTGFCRSGEVAKFLGKTAAQQGAVRQRCIEKGVLYSPSYGDIDFTAPLFGDFMRRIMPGDEWRDVDA